ncbi:VWA domain-containing protein [Mediterraneibacter gnavus]|uniref:VWA domain-containing protein n=2 Tax=Lachnospirales TaxID=3085636 RepID=A0A414SBF7_MEDGN|nr:VWA domain-containing protein [Mediterraneibacter gnavus]
MYGDLCRAREGICMRSKEIGNSRQTEKRLLRDMEVFSSPQFLRLVQRIGKEITDKHDAQIRFYSDATDHRAGYFEGRYIYINTMNMLTQSFPTLDLRSKSLIGVEGHECGHQNYSSIYLRRKYIDGIASGILYPAWPLPETERETGFLQSMKEGFQKKDAVLLGLYLQTAGRLHGYLEDAFIEEQMCRRFPGSIRQGILQNRKRNMEQISSLKSQIVQKKSKLKIMLLLLVQYMFTNKVNVWDGEVAEYMELLRNCIPVLLKTTVDMGESARYLATNQILLKLWPLLLEEAEGMERKIKSTGEDKENVLKQTFDEWKEDLPQYSEEPSCRKIRMERKEASDVLWNGGELKYTVSEEIQSIQMEGESATKGQESLREEKTESLLSELQQETVKTIDIGRELQNICLELKREAREKGYEEWMRERLKEILENTEFTPVNREIKKRVFRKEVISQTAYQKYRIFQPQIKHTLMKMKQDLLPVLKRKKTHILRYQYIGKRLDMAHLWNPEKRIFQTKIPSQNMDTAIVFLLDQSGSIDSKRWETSVLTALCVVEFAQVFGIPVCVNGHCTGREHIGRKREEIVCLHSYLEFGEKEEGKYRILDMETGGANRDGAALLYMAEKMVKRKEKMKILIFFCDGLPNAQGYGGKVAREDLQKVQRQLKQKQITLFVAAIGRDQEDIQNIYGNACINAENLEQLPHQIVKKLLEYMG